MARHGTAALALSVFSLGLGMAGYAYFERLPWLDAFLNTAMLLGGMGPVGEVTTASGKLFAAFFALYAGLMLIGVTTLVLAPVIHRILHTVHLEEPDVDESEEG